MSAAGTRMSLRADLLAYLRKPLVRPWALSAPIVVLLTCLPLLRPLTHPSDASEDESLRLASVQALLDHHSLALPPDPRLDPAMLVRVDNHLYAAQPPAMAVLLSGPARLLRRAGWDLKRDPAVVAYILTLLAVTIPVAGGAGLIYRMTRLFELPRPWRALIALSVTVGSGLLSYATVLNAQAPAAVCLIAAAAALIHLESIDRPRRGWGWIVAAGFFAALAAALEPATVAVGLPLLFVIAFTKFSLRFRLGGVLLFLLGAAPVVALHAAWNVPITGDLLPANVHRELSARPIASRQASPEPETDADDVIATSGFWLAVGNTCQWLCTALIGTHGLLSHFPILILGVGGVGAVMHRHWPTPVKILAAASLIGTATVMAVLCWARKDWHDAMFASRWFIPFLPLLLFWGGAWLRRSHGRVAWTLAGAMLVYSFAVSIVGATNPTPREGYDNYTALGAFERLITSYSPRDAMAPAASNFSSLIREC